MPPRRGILRTSTCRSPSEENLRAVESTETRCWTCRSPGGPVRIDSPAAVNRSNVHGAERFEFVVGYRFLRVHTRDEAVVATLLRPPGIRFSSRVRSGAMIVNSAVSSNGVWGGPPRSHARGTRCSTAILLDDGGAEELTVHGSEAFELVVVQLVASVEPDVGELLRRSTSLSIARTPRMWSWSTCVITKTSMGRARRLLRTRPRVDERLWLCLTSKRG
jgi:hypothetical protein